MSLSVSQVEQTVAELKLAPTTREYLSASLSTYAELKHDIEALQHLLEIEKMTIGKVLEESGVDKARTEQFALTWVRGATSSTLDKKKLLASGVSLAQIENATVVKPKKPYFQIRDLSRKPASELSEE